MVLFRAESLRRICDWCRLEERFKQIVLRVSLLGKRFAMCVRRKKEKNEGKQDLNAGCGGHCLSYCLALLNKELEKLCPDKHRPVKL